MKHWLTSILTLTVGMLAAVASASAQSAALPDCSPEAIRQALAGDYAGPPCRFTEMPTGQDRVPARQGSPQLAGPPPVDRPAAARTSAVSLPRMRPHRPRIDETRQPVRRPRAGTARSAGEVVRLGDGFFNGELVGGVGQVPAVQYGYRGLLVIDASGRTSLLPPGRLSATPILRMEARGALRTQWVGQ